MIVHAPSRRAERGEERTTMLAGRLLDEIVDAGRSRRTARRRGRGSAR